MYTYEYNYYDGYMILDPYGEYIITVQSEHEAETLLSHLNQAEANKPIIGRNE